MAALRLLLAGTDPRALADLRRTIDALPGIGVVAEAADLSSTYLLAERTEPDIAILGADLEAQPDFEGLLSVFQLLGTACLRLLPGLSPCAGKAPDGRVLLCPALAPEEVQRRLTAAMEGRKRRPLAAPVPAATPARPLAGAPAAAGGRLVLIGASTGGIDALIQILSAFPADGPATAIVQHTGAAFSSSLIRLLARCCPARVQAAEAGVEIAPGTVTIGAGCPGHLRLAPGRPFRARVEAGPPISGHLPSVDALFQSAVPFAPQVSAALLTGMGRDGAQGLLDLRRAGAVTMAQDAATSVVFGMPRAAAEMGAAEQILPLKGIAAALLAPAPTAARPAEARGA